MQKFWEYIVDVTDNHFYLRSVQMDKYNLNKLWSRDAFLSRP